MKQIERRIKPGNNAKGSAAVLSAALFLSFAYYGLYRLTGSVCLFQAFLGVPCPGCGSTRAVISLFHGDVYAALAWHPLIFVSLALIAYAAVRGLFFRKLPARFARAEKIAAAALLVLYAGVFIFRMIELFPRTEPLVPSDSSVLRQILRLFREKIF